MLIVAPPQFDLSAWKVKAQVEDQLLVFQLKPNNRGRLAQAQSEPFAAPTFVDAERIAYRALAPILSYWSALLDVPLSVASAHLVEHSSGSLRVSFVSPFWVMGLSPAALKAFDPDLRHFVALYREALCSASEAYQFLSLFKIAEGLYKRRARLSRTRGHVQHAIEEKFPSSDEELTPWLNALFPGNRPWDPVALNAAVPPRFRGKRFGTVREELDPIRTRIAHALVGSDEYGHTGDDEPFSSELYEAIPVLRGMAQAMLRNEFPDAFRI